MRMETSRTEHHTHTRARADEMNQSSLGVAIIHTPKACPVHDRSNSFTCGVVGGRPVAILAAAQFTSHRWLDRENYPRLFLPLFGKIERSITNATPFQVHFLQRRNGQNNSIHLLLLYSSTYIHTAVLSNHTMHNSSGLSSRRELHQQVPQQTTQTASEDTTYSSRAYYCCTWMRCPVFVAYATADCRPSCPKPGENVAHAGACVGARPAHSPTAAFPVFLSGADSGGAPPRPEGWLAPFPGGARNRRAVSLRS